MIIIYVCRFFSHHSYHFLSLLIFPVQIFLLGRSDIGQTARACNLRWDEHGKAIQKENWSHSGISQHHQHCQEQYDKANATVITTMQGKNKKSLAYNLKVREALEIRRHNSGPGKGLNEDMGAYVKTDLWDPVLHTMD